MGSLYFKPSDQPKPISNSFIMKVLIVLAISFAALTSADHVAGGHHHPVHHHQFQQPRQARAPQFNNFRQYPSAPAPAPATLPTIAEAAVGTPSLSTLVAALKAANLVEAFAGEGKFTVFAPNNDAFAKITRRHYQATTQVHRNTTRRVIKYRKGSELRTV